MQRRGLKKWIVEWKNNAYYKTMKVFFDLACMSTCYWELPKPKPFITHNRGTLREHVCVNTIRCVWTSAITQSCWRFHLREQNREQTSSPQCEESLLGLRLQGFWDGDGADASSALQMEECVDNPDSQAPLMTSPSPSWRPAVARHQRPSAVHFCLERPWKRG